MLIKKVVGMILSLVKMGVLFVKRGEQHTLQFRVIFTFQFRNWMEGSLMILINHINFYGVLML